jgi:membrane protein implicated in regulation of membrane protease activity
VNTSAGAAVTIRAGMVLILFVLISLLFDDPWNFVVIGIGVVLEIGEIYWGRKLARRWRPHTGAEALVGSRAEVVEECRPKGSVRVQGELWRATCAAGASVGETVRILAVQDLTLEVEPVLEATASGEEAPAV